MAQKDKNCSGCFWRNSCGIRYSNRVKEHCTEKITKDEFIGLGFYPERKENENYCGIVC